VSRGGTFETHAQAPDKALTVIQAHPVGTIQFGYNGKSAWHSNGKAVTWLKGVDLAVVQRETDYFAALRIKNNFSKVSLPGMSKIGYRDVYVLDLQPAAGPLERLYLDAQTYLPVRLNTTRAVGRVSQPVEVYFDDWREIGGVKYPFSISQNSPSLKLAFTVKEVRQNVAIDAKVFQAPGPPR
jgi:outer membrane lipoprotein-sorting protein